jgi:hypothetical protein
MSMLHAESAAFNRAHLKSSFEKVPVGLKLLGGPISPANPSIFQMNIHQSRGFGEYVQIWPGDRGNEIEVLSFDPAFVQLVLRVREPRRPYLEVVQKRGFMSLERDAARIQERVRASGGRIVKETRHDWRLELWTPEIDRRYLCGRDDVHLFIAQVREGDTVAQAHHSLKPEVVREAEAVWPGRIQRQGEWFFLPLSAEESEALDAHLTDWPGAVRLNQGVAPGRRPHVADAVVTIDRRTRTRHREYRRPHVYARGTVTHSDHVPIQLDGWRRVVRNSEVGGSGDGVRVKWID